MQSGTSESLRAARPRLTPLFNIRGFFIFTNMQLYKTNSGIGYKEEAFFIKGFRDKYICVGGDFESDIYEIGEEYSLEEYEIELENKLKIENFAISKTYLFNFWLHHLQHFIQQNKA